jgi:hypothetical protein
VTVCHFPPGTSKWNKVEHRLFSHISMNWRGRPLVSHEVIGRADRRDPDPRRPQGPRRARPTQLPAGRQDLRPGPGRGAAAPPRLAWGVELHRPPRCRVATPRIKLAVREPFSKAAVTHAVRWPARRAPLRALHSDSSQRSPLGSGGAGARAAEGPAVGRW